MVSSLFDELKKYSLDVKEEERKSDDKEIMRVFTKACEKLSKTIPSPSTQSTSHFNPSNLSFGLNFLN